MSAKGEARPASVGPLEAVRAFYEAHPYPAPVDSLEKRLDRYRDPRRRRAQSLLLWPLEKPRADRKILVAGCGASQAARYALAEPEAQVTGIDVSETSIGHTRALQQRHGLDNLRLRRLAVERVGQPAETSTRSSAPACCTTLPIPTQVCAPCARSSRLTARCFSWSTPLTVEPELR